MRRVTMDEAKEAVRDIASSAVRTPLIPSQLRTRGGGAIFLKLENLQPIGSFKIRGAANAFAKADQQRLHQHGVATASAGNMGQGVACEAARQGVQCTVVVPKTAPSTKVAAIKRHNAKVVPVPYDDWWAIIETGRCPQAPDSVFIHPVLNQDVMAGNSTIGVEVLEDLPSATRIFVPYGGGALASGIGSVMKSQHPKCRIVAVEPETAAPFALSLKKGRAMVFPDWRPSFVDGCGGKAVIPAMWKVASSCIDEAATPTLTEIEDAVTLLAERHRIVAEGAGASALAAALKCDARGPVVCIISGGCLDTPVLLKILQKKSKL